MLCWIQILLSQKIFCYLISPKVDTVNYVKLCVTLASSQNAVVLTLFLFVFIRVVCREKKTKNKQQRKNGRKARSSSSIILWCMWFTSRILWIRTRIRQVQTLADRKRTRTLPGSYQRSAFLNPNFLNFCVYESYICSFFTDADSNDADKVSTQLQSTSISDGKASSGNSILKLCLQQI